MIPVLYDDAIVAAQEGGGIYTDRSQIIGVGALADAISCTVTEERNGIYELEITYPVTGMNFDKLKEGAIVGATHDMGGDLQPFDIYAHSAEIGGTVTFYGHHISYRLNKVMVSPFTVTTCAAALGAIRVYAINTPVPLFKIKADPVIWEREGTMVNAVPRSYRSLLGGQAGSVLDVYGGGEYLFNWNIIWLMQHRGEDRGFVVRYGANMTDMTQDVDSSGLYNAIAPYWRKDDEIVLLNNGSGYVTNAAAGDTILMTALDLSDKFEAAPTEAQLRTAAEAYLADGMTPRQNVTVKFIADDSGTPLYLCDTVTVEHEDMGISYKAKVIKVVWDALRDRYIEFEIGSAQKSLVQAAVEAVEADMSPETIEKIYSAVSRIGKVTKTGIASLEVSSGSWQDVLSISLDAGTYVLTGSATLANAAGTSLTVMISSGSAQARDSVTGVSGIAVTAGASDIVELTEQTTIYLRVYVSAALTVYNGYLAAVRII